MNKVCPQSLIQLMLEGTIEFRIQDSISTPFLTYPQKRKKKLTNKKKTNQHKNQPQIKKRKKSRIKTNKKFK
jgi:hypothetical protein